ncbi:MAG: hypothetical protein HDS31_03535 [Bacteroides sp.]|nr:hypothetical protein [Bacteroides sp.]
MKFHNTLLSAVLAATVAIPSFADTSATDYAFTTFSPSPAETRTGGLMKDTTNSRIEYERDMTRRVIDNTHILTFGGDKTSPVENDSIRELLYSFYENQFRHTLDPMTPYFMLMSKDATMAMGIGGVIRMRGWYDFNGSIDANGFSPYLIPVPRQPDQLRALGCTPAGTAIYFSILGRHTPIGNFMGYIEANFNGYSHVGFQLKKAYFTINNFTVGYDTSTFSDPAAEPVTIDGSGANGKMSKTNVLVRYLKTFKGHYTVGGSVEFPGSSIGADNVYTKKLKDFTPDLVVMTQYQWDQSVSHVRLSGLFRTLPYRDLLTKKNHTKIGWGVQASCVAKTSRSLTLYGITAIGQGHASYAGDLAIGPNDLLPTPHDNGSMYTPTSLSLIAGAKYNFLENLYACVALSELRAYTKADSPADTYKYGLYGAVNLFWKITPRLELGGEYLIGKRKNVDGSHGNANRIDAFVQFAF